MRVLSSRAASQICRHQKLYNATHADQYAHIDATAEAFTIPWLPLQASSQSHRKHQTYACIAGYASKPVIAQCQTAQDARRKLQSPDPAHPLTNESRKKLPCDYTPSPFLPVATSESLVLKSGSSAARLSPHGASVLVGAVNTSLYATSTRSTTAKLSSYAADMLDFANIDLISALHDFGPSVRHWSPTMHEHVLKQGSDFVIARHPLLALGAWLVTSPPVGDPRRSELYVALKQIVAALQSRNRAEMEPLQLGLSLAVYEVGHGMIAQAFQTLSGCKAMLILLEREFRDSGDKQVQETMDWLKASLLMLDRYVTSSG